MNQGRKTIAVTDFKARCLELIDEVARSGEALVITKRGNPVARLIPIERTKPASMRGSVQYHGDIVAPTGEKWDVFL